MVVGRIVGWMFLGFALLLGSGDVVLALAPGDHGHIATGDIWTLLSGKTLPPGLSLAGLLMALPAWSLIGTAGVGLAWACRPRRRRYFASHR